MKKYLKYAVLSSILILYALLYMATSKPMPCEDLCEKLVRMQQLASRPYITSHDMCNNNTYCVFVDTSYQKNWASVSDTICGYIRDVRLGDFMVLILNRDRQNDTLHKRKCN
jgi:hypothetical protein